MGLSRTSWHKIKCQFFKRITIKQERKVQEQNEKERKKKKIKKKIKSEIKGT